jgi:ribosomal protein L37E
MCDRCSRLGHPAFACKVQLCSYCGKFHDGKCQEYQTFQAIKDLVRNGIAHRHPSVCPEVTSGRRGQSRNAVKPISPLDGDPERAGLKFPRTVCLSVCRTRAEKKKAR